jgi:predicted RNA-binding protein YlxR (DUF448 family)
VAPKNELLRIAVSRDGGAPARAMLDRRGTMAGRGAYLCRDAGSRAPRAACLQAALKRRAIPRALRCAVPIDDELLESVGP